MNIHEYQAKEILKKYGAPVSNGVVINSLSEIKSKVSKLKGNKFVLKAQIHAGGRGKAGGVKLVNSLNELNNEAKNLLGKILVTKQTSKDGKKVEKIYIEEASDISNEFYLSCLVDRATSKLAYISSTEGGVDIEKVASETPEKIITTRTDLNNDLSNELVEKILKPFNLNSVQKKEGKKLLTALRKILIEKDASLIEINPLIITKNNNILCLDAKMNFDDNVSSTRNIKFRDLTEEEPAEIEASKHDLAYIKLDGSIGCMVNGAGLAMATMDIIKLYGKEPANFLDVGGGASKDKVSAAFKLILSDKNVKNFNKYIWRIMRCDVLAQGVVDAAKESKLSVPLVVRLAGTNFKRDKKY